MSQVKLVKDHRDDFPIEWKSKTLFLSQITVGIKQAFCNWLLRSMLDAAGRAYGKDSQDFKDYQTKLFAAPPSWNVIPSPSVAASLVSEDGSVFMSRLLLGLTYEQMSDEELREFLTVKGDETSDFLVAMQQIKESSDPKALKPVE